MGKIYGASPGKQVASSEEILLLVHEVLEGIPRDLTHGDVEHWRARKLDLHRELRKLLFCGHLPEDEALAEWQRLYGSMLAPTITSPEWIKLDGRPKNFEQLVVVHRTMSLVTIGSIYGQMGVEIKFKGISHEDMEDARHKRYGDRIGRVPYALWTRNEQDPEIAGISADDIARMEISFMNLPEFLILFWKYWQDTGLPFSADFTTLLPDTYFKGGGFARAHWTGSCLEIGRVPRDFKGSKSCGIRQICPVV